MASEQIISIINERIPKYQKFLFDICNIEATAYDKPEIDKMLDYISLFSQKEGFSVYRTNFKNCGDFLTVEMNEGNEKGAVLLAHTDTVHKKGSFGNPAVRLEGDRMIGPGTIDCKGGIAIALLAMYALRKTGYSKHIRLLLTSDEEISNVLGGEDELKFFNDQSVGFPYAINCETSENNEVVISRRGLLRYEISVTGKGGHSGIHYFETKNPILECANKIVSLQNLSKKGGITYSCNIINAGTAFNVIPDKYTFSVDVRIATHNEMETADKIVREIAKKSFIGDTTSEVTLKGKRLPMEFNDDTKELFQKLYEISNDYNLGKLIPVHSGGGSDSAYTQSAGVASICGVGGLGGYCHTNREYIELDSIPKRAKLISLLLYKNQT